MSHFAGENCPPHLDPSVSAAGETCQKPIQDLQILWGHGVHGMHLVGGLAAVFFNLSPQ